MLRQTMLFLAVVATESLVAQSPKPPWTLTVEERIALRTNPELARERVRRDRGVKTSSALSANRDSRPIADSFDGKTHPELFLPHQVFDELVKLAFLGSPRTGEVVRKGFVPEVRRHGLPRDFWERLEALSTVYCADFRAVTDLIGARARQQSVTAGERFDQALALRHEDACRSRADAFAAARREFGRERFDRFLYEVIATGMFSVADRLPDPELLRWTEEGCR